MTFNIGDKVKADGKAGTITGSSTYGELWPENVRSKNNRIDAKSSVYAVTLDGETRPRNYFPAQLNKE